MIPLGEAKGLKVPNRFDWLAYLVLAVWAGYLIDHAFFPLYTGILDDAWMFLRYADHLATGAGYSWNATGPPTFGCTSLAFTVWLAGLRLIWPAAETGAYLLLGSSLGFFLAGTALLMELVFRLVGQKIALSRPWCYLAVAIFLTNQHFLFHAISGMDTTLAFASNVGFLAALLRLGAQNRLLNWGLFLLAAYVSYLVRMDHLIFLLVSPVVLLRWRSQWTWSRLIRLMLILGLILGLHTLLTTWYFGSPLPLPFAVKKYGFYAGYTQYDLWNPLEYMEAFGALTLPAVLLGMACWQAQNQKHRATMLAFLLPLLLTFGVFMNSVQIMGMDMRLYAPFVPHVLVAAALLWYDAPAGKTIRSPRMLAMLIWMVSVLGLMPQLTIRYQDFLAGFSEPGKAMVPSEALVMETPALGLNEAASLLAMEVTKLPANSKVAAGEHGFFGALIPEYFILDLTGLHDPRIKGGADIVPLVAQEQPLVIWMPSRAYASLWQEMLQADFFQNNYHFFPSAYQLGLALRKDAVTQCREAEAFLPYLRAAEEPHEAESSPAPASD